jgi:hypothetical protein
MSEPEPDAVSALLALSELAPPPDDHEFLVAAYPIARAMAAALYAVPEARYAEPALIFHARP